MAKIYSYVLRYDDGAAPNPFWGICTLTICKPVIRRKAEIGDWVIGTGSKRARCSDGSIHDLSNCIVYAMKISDKKTLEDYDAFCKKQLVNKIPNSNATDWRIRAGDCIYDYSAGSLPAMRGNVHNEIDHRDRDLSGIYSLLSDRFYYFGEEARPLPPEFKQLIKRNRGHLKIVDRDIITAFEKWICQFERNKIYAEPQACSLFKGNDIHISGCNGCNKQARKEKRKGGC